MCPKCVPKAIPKTTNRSHFGSRVRDLFFARHLFASILPAMAKVCVARDIADLDWYALHMISQISHLEPLKGSDRILIRKEAEELRDWMGKNQLAEADECEAKLEQVKWVCVHILVKANAREAKKTLHDYCISLQEQQFEDADKAKIKNAVLEMYNWMDTYPDACKEAIQLKLLEFVDSIVNPIMMKALAS